MLKNLWKLIVPTMGFRVLSQGPFFGVIIATYFDDTSKLAGLVLGMTLATILYIFLRGALQPLDTLTSHAYGSGNMRLCCIYLYQSIFVGLACTAVLVSVTAYMLFNQ